jgi:hypothetical protein
MIMEGDKIAIKCEWQYQPPNKRASQALVKVGSLSLRVTQGIVGDKGWIKVGPALAVDLTPEQVLGLTWEHENHVRNAQWLARLRTEFEPVNVKGVKIGEYDAWQVDFKPKATASVKTPLAIFFDKKTGKGVGSEGDHVVPTLGDEKVREKTAKFRAIFKSIIEVEGVKMPGTFTLQRDGVPILEVRKAEVRFVDKIDQKLFEKPK